MAIKVKKTVLIDFHGANARYYSHYRTEILNLLKNDFTPKNIDKIKEIILEKYNDIDPFDTPYDIKGISPEEKKIFVQKKRELNQNIHNIIIEEVFKDIEADDPNLVLRNKEIRIPVDFPDIQTQTKYLSHVIETLQEKVIRKTTTEITKLHEKTKEPETKEAISNIIKNIEGELRNLFLNNPKTIIQTNTFKVNNNNLGNVSFISKEQNKASVKNITEKIIREALSDLKENSKLQDKLAPVFERTLNFVKNNLVANKIEEVLDRTSKELGHFNNNLQRIDSNELIGLSNYADKLTVFSEVLSNNNVSISTNFFNEQFDIFKNSAGFLYGWTMESLTTTALIQNDPSYLNKDITMIKPEDWQRIGHYHGSVKVYIDEKDSGLYFQGKNLKQRKEDTFNINETDYSKEEILNTFNETKKLLRVVEKNFNKKIIEKYMNGTENLNEDIEKILIELDELLHNHPMFKKSSEMFTQENNIEKSNFVNHKKTLMEKISQINKTIKFNKMMPNTLHPYQQKMIANYTLGRNMPMADTFVHKNGIIEEIHEVKTISKTQGKIRLPFNFSKEIKNNRNSMSEIFDTNNGAFNFRLENIEKMKSMSSEIFEKQTSKENSLQGIGLDTKNLFYIFNIIDERSGTTTLYKVPLESYYELYKREDILENVVLGKRNAYKFFCDIESDFFEKVFETYKISPTEKIKPIGRERNPRP